MLEPIVISLEKLNLFTLLPVGILILGALLIICLDIAIKNLNRRFYAILALIFTLLSFVSLLGFNGANKGFFNMMLIDGISILSSLIILAVSALFLLFALSKETFHEYSMAEFFALFLFMNAGFIFMTSTNNLILIFVGLETGSLALYTIIAMHNRLKSIEAALKYFTMGALAAGFFAFGAMIFYGVTGSIEINAIGANLLLRDGSVAFAVVAAFILLLGALGFKLSLIPFHTWTPDVYEGASAPTAGYMSIVPKIAAFVVLMRIFEVLSAVNAPWIDSMLYILTIVTMTLGNIMALIQKDVKRMLAFSSISHAGFLLAAILIGTNQADGAFFLYWIMFALANIGAFGILWISRHKQPLWHKRYEHPFEKFSGLIKLSPIMALTMALFMFSLAGIPPFSLFWGKLFLISSALNGGYIILAIIMAINSAIAVYYYLKLIVFMFLKEPLAKDNSAYMYNISNSLKFVVALTLIGSILAIFLVEPMLQNIAYYLTLR